MKSNRPPPLPRRGIRRGPPPPLNAKCALFLDIDGTLVDLAPTPSHVEVDPALATLLPALAARLGGATALITGRPIQEADNLFPGLGLPVAGLHGLERRSADGVLHPHAPAPAGFVWLRGELMRIAARHPGLLLEDKGTALALHYRLAPALASYVHRTTRALVKTASAGGAAWRLQPGKGIVEIKPRGRDKGAAILDYMAEAPFMGRVPVFIGDDLTDEFGFAAVCRIGGWAVKVGPGPTHANYRISGVAAVRQWLLAFSEHRSPSGERKH